MKKPLFFLLLSFISFSVIAQLPQLQWAVVTYTSGSATSRAITTDDEGNVYTVGNFFSSGDFDLDPGPSVQINPTYGENDVFIMKFSPFGDLIWAKSLGGIYIDSAEGIAIDDEGQVYVSGSFQETVDFDPGAGEHMITCNGVYNAFVLKLDANGNFQWVHTVESAYALSADVVAKNGQVYMTGRVDGSGNFDPGNTNYSITGGSIFLLKLSSEGDFEWAVMVMGLGSNSEPFGMTLDAVGNVMIVGRFDNQADFNPSGGVANLTPVALWDPFYWKVDADGNYLSAFSFGGTSQEVAEDITVDSEGNILITGNFTTSVDFDPGPNTNTIASTYGNDAFILKLNANEEFLWVKTIAGESFSIGHGIATDAQGNVYVAGEFDDETTDFDPGPGEYLLQQSDVESFLLQLDANGEFVGASTIQGSNLDYALDVAIDHWNNIYTTGYFHLDADFDPSASLEQYSAIGFSGYIWKLGPPCDLTVSLSASDIQICAGEQIQLNNTGTSDYNNSWYINGDLRPENSDTIDLLFDEVGTQQIKLIGTAAACRDSASIEIQVHPNPEVVLNAVPATCGSNNGSINAIANGGSSWTYLWDDSSTSSTLSDLGSGTYHLLVTNEFNCEVEGSATVEAFGIPQLSISATGVLCAGENNGTMSVVVSGGMPPYTILWSDGSTETTVMNVEAGDYGVQVTDASACTSSNSITVSEPEELQASIVCTPTEANMDNGSATVTVIGGTPPYTYTWNIGGNTPTLNALAQGEVIATITDDHDCTTVSSCTVEVINGVEEMTTTSTSLQLWPNPASANINITLTLPKPSSVKFFVSDIHGKILLHWTEKGSGQINTTLNIENLASGIYIIKAVSENGVWNGEVVVR